MRPYREAQTGVSVEATIERQNALSKRTMGILQSNVVMEEIILGG
jgi:hypothetical protein